MPIINKDTCSFPQKSTLVPMSVLTGIAQLF